MFGGHNALEDPHPNPLPEGRAKTPSADAVAEEGIKPLSVHRYPETENSMSSGPQAFFLMVYAVLGLLLVTTAQAKSAQTPRKPAPPPASSPAVSTPEPSWLQVEITPLEKEIVQQHAVDIRKMQGKKPASGKPLPPGFAKKVARGGALPPGWQQKITRGEVLPPAVYAQAQPLPEVIIRKLPPAPAGTVLVTIDGKLLRLLEATHTILDVFEFK